MTQDFCLYLSDYNVVKQLYVLRRKQKTAKSQNKDRITVKVIAI